MIKNNSVLSGLLWSYAERFGKEGVSLLISIVLANLLMPEEFGAIALLTVFISLSNALIVTGFSTALIQKKEVDETDRSTVFFFSFFAAILLYGVLFVTAPIIASYYKLPILKNVLRVISLSLPIGAYNAVQTSIVIRELKFRVLFFSSLCAVVFSGVAGIIAAYLGLGIWALVIQNLSSVVVSCITLQFQIRWRPHRCFSWSKLKALVSFGWKITCSSIVDVFYNNAFSLVIGKKYSTEDLAYYNRGQQFPLLLAKNVTSAISTVMLPVFSKMQDDREQLKSAVRRSITICSLVMFPLIMGLLACSKPLIYLLYSEKWAEAIPYMQLFCVSFLFYPINMANTQAMNGMGRSDLFLKLNAIKKGLGIAILLFSMRFGVLGIAAGYAASTLFNVFINILPNKKLLKYGLYEQVKDIFIPLVCAAIMCGICYLVLLLNLSNILTLILQVVVGGVVYIASMFLLQYEPFFYVASIVKSIANRSKE